MRVVAGEPGNLKITDPDDLRAAESPAGLAGGGERARRPGDRRPPFLRGPAPSARARRHRDRRRRAGWVATATPTPSATRWPTPCSVRSASATSAATSPTPTRPGRARTAWRFSPRWSAWRPGRVTAVPTPTAPSSPTRPRLAPHTAAMATRLSEVIGAPVSVKATWAEGLGVLRPHRGDRLPGRRADGAPVSPKNRSSRGGRACTGPET